MNLNLQEFVDPITAEICNRCAQFDAAENDGPGQAGDPVQQITLGFQFDQDAWCALVFDTRSLLAAAFDGNWQSHIQENILECDCDLDLWLEAYECLFDDQLEEVVHVTAVDGSTHVIQPHSEPDDDGKKEEEITEKLAGLIGETLRQALIAAKEKGAFKHVPVSDSCVLRIDEHSSGAYCWPDFESHGTVDDVGLIKK